MNQILQQWLYPTSLSHALIIQKEMREKVRLEDDFKSPLSLIAGMDVSNNLFDPKQLVYAASFLLSYPDLTIVETSSQKEKQALAYIPGLLGFREAPALLHAFEKLKRKPNLIFVDGHGVSHPRALGIASHLGVLLDIPTIGVAKSILVGTVEGILGDEVGSTSALVWKGQTIALALRSKKRCSPIYISAGHRITLDTALTLVNQCFRGYKLPEPTRRAHLAANAARKLPEELE